MTTYDIELPQGYAERPFDYSGDLYTEGQVRAIIEADRQRRGEPGEIQCRIYHGTEQHRDYLKARFHSDAWKNRVSFEWQGHRWAYRYTHFDDFGEYDLIARTAPQPAEPDAPAVSDYEAAMADHRRLVRELDVLLNGDGAAEQASLCDIVAQVRREGIKIAESVKVPSDAEIGQILKEVLHNSRYGVHQWELWLEFASALFTRYGGGTP